MITIIFAYCINTGLALFQDGEFPAFTEDFAVDAPARTRYTRAFRLRAQMAELVDALVSGTSDLTVVEVRVLFWAPVHCFIQSDILQKFNKNN